MFATKGTKWTAPYLHEHPNQNYLDKQMHMTSHAPLV